MSEARRFLFHISFLRIAMQVTRFSGRRAFHQSSSLWKKYYDIVVPVREAREPVTVPGHLELRVHRLPVSQFPRLCPHGRFTYEELTDDQKRSDLRSFGEGSVFTKQVMANTALVEIRSTENHDKNRLSAYVPIPEWLDLSLRPQNASAEKALDFWHQQEPSLREAMTDNSYPDLCSTTTVLKKAFNTDKLDPQLEHSLFVQCTDPEHAQMQRHWGFYRRRISTNINHLSKSILPDGNLAEMSQAHSLAIRLVGVGYRASVETMTITGKDGKNDALLFERWINHWSHLITKDPIRAYIAQHFPNSIWAQMWRLRRFLTPETSLYFSTHSDQDAFQVEGELPKTIQKLVLKLGYSHTIEMPVPPFMQCSVPNPSKIVLNGPFSKQMKEFAMNVRKWRRPEPYKGKGVFVGDETIQLKQKKIK